MTSGELLGRFRERIGLPDLCAVCRRQAPLADLEEQCGIGPWWRCRDRKSCEAACPQYGTPAAAPSGPADPAAIVAEWRSLRADIRLDVNTARDPADDEAPQWLHLGKGWCYLPEGLRRRVQDNQEAVVRYLREEAQRG